MSVPATTAPNWSPLLRAEAACVLAAALFAYAHTGSSWGWFAALFLLPDIALLAYVVGPLCGAFCYNACHSYIAPLLLGVMAYGYGYGDAPFALSVALVWVAHIAFDRVLGYGLKSRQGFAVTHLGLIGHAKALAAHA